MEDFTGIDINSNEFFVSLDIFSDGKKIASGTSLGKIKIYNYDASRGLQFLYSLITSG